MYIYRFVCLEPTLEYNRGTLVDLSLKNTFIYRIVYRIVLYQVEGGSIN